LASVEGKKLHDYESDLRNCRFLLRTACFDNELVILNQNIKIQNDALDIIKELKRMPVPMNLPVKRFQAQVLKTQGMQYDIQQKIVETENKINYLVGRFPQPVERSQDFNSFVPQAVYTGIPSELLENRPDIKQAEYELAASRLDIKSAKARFYPSLDIGAGVGLQAFNPTYLIKPESFLFSLAGELTAPLINRSAIKAAYYNANANRFRRFIIMSRLFWELILKWRISFLKSRI
jgi:outer membrane protein TolC